MRVVCAAGLLLALGLSSAGAVAGNALAPDLFGLGTDVCEEYEQVFVFSSLRYGEFDYCRLHLRYHPGAADCLRIVAPTCNVLGPEVPHRTFLGPEDFLLAGRAERILCPPGPPPPSCPAGFPSGPIPR